MSQIGRMLLIAAGTWSVTVAISILILMVSAGATQKWTAGRLQPVIIILLAVMALLHTAGIVFAYFMGKRALLGGPLWIYTVAYAAAAVITLFITGFITIVVFNR